LECTHEERRDLYLEVHGHGWVLDALDVVLHLILDEVDDGFVEVDGLHDRLLVLVRGEHGLLDEGTDHFALDLYLHEEAPSDVGQDL
jgi:hypothetical protein